VPLIDKLHHHLLELQPEVLPKSPSGAAVRYSLNQWQALTRFLQDGELEIDNGATERANRDIALGRGNWTFFGRAGPSVHQEANHCEPGISVCGRRLQNDRRL
jgi:hypothetical protein